MIVTHDENKKCNNTINKRITHKHNESIAGVIIASYINKQQVTYTKIVDNKVWQPRMRFNTCDFGDPDDLHYLVLTEKNEMCCINEGI